jgi:hypothetical protein
MNTVHQEIIRDLTNDLNRDLKSHLDTLEHQKRYVSELQARIDAVQAELSRSPEEVIQALREVRGSLIPFLEAVGGRTNLMHRLGAESSDSPCRALRGTVGPSYPALDLRWRNIILCRVVEDGGTITPDYQGITSMQIRQFGDEKEEVTTDLLFVIRYYRTARSFRVPLKDAVALIEEMFGVRLTGEEATVATPPVKHEVRIPRELGHLARDIEAHMNKLNPRAEFVVKTMRPAASKKETK